MVLWIFFYIFRRNLRKLVSILTTFFYLVSLTGMTISVHKCQGKTSYEFLGISYNKSCKCVHLDESHSSKCCSNHKVVIKKNTNDNFFNKNIIQFKPVSSGTHIVPAYFRSDLYAFNYSNTCYNDKAPPDLYACPLYIVNRVILIWFYL